jgi:hypothetical protein
MTKRTDTKLELTLAVTATWLATLRNVIKLLRRSHFHDDFLMSDFFFPPDRDPTQSEMAKETRPKLQPSDAAHYCGP